MGIDTEYTTEHGTYIIHCQHLGTGLFGSWKLARFVDFFTERYRNGVPFHEIIETWNNFAKHPEDTVYVVRKPSVAGPVSSRL
jgi:hypothetical protein